MSCHGDTFDVTLLLGVSHLLQLVFVSFLFLLYLFRSRVLVAFPFFYVQVQFLSHAIFYFFFAFLSCFFFSYRRSEGVLVTDSFLSREADALVSFVRL